eukprot:13184633-Heterocapsa_arctica.AAC.1
MAIEPLPATDVSQSMMYAALKSSKPRSFCGRSGSPRATLAPTGSAFKSVPSVSRTPRSKFTNSSS